MSKQNKILNFLKKNGFYLCLAVCVLGVGLAIFFGTANNTPEEEKEQQTEQQVQAIQTPAVTSVARPSVSPSPTPSPTVSPSPSPAVEEPEVREERSVSSSRTYLAMPLDGEITGAFSGETLVYNSTLNMWMTHNGVDIASTSTDQVVSALPGEVTRVYTDETRGMVVEITHANDAKTIYAGLKETGVNEGGLVNAGTVIGKAGTPAFEAAAGQHLHFEYIVDGEYKDPAEYFK